MSVYGYFELVRVADCPDTVNFGLYTWQCKLCWGYRGRTNPRGIGIARSYDDTLNPMFLIDRMKPNINAHWRKYHFGHGEADSNALG